MSQNPSFEELVIKPLSQGDLEEMHRIEELVYTDPWTFNLLEQSLKATMTFTIGLAETKTNGICKGYAIYQVIFNEAHLLNIAIHPDIQNRGEGARLLEAVLSDSRRRGADSMYLEVRPSNSSAQKLYEKRGFRCLMVREKYYSNGEAAVIMLCDLKETI